MTDRPFRYSPVPAFGLVLMVAGCSNEPDAASPDADLPEPIEATIDLSIGVAEGDDAYMFGRISGGTADDEGRIYVADAQAHEVRVFDADGNHLFSFGQQEEGPISIALSHLYPGSATSDFPPVPSSS